MKTVFTIGYEGASLADFLATLETAGVQHVMDVRELPQSRRPGFSKNVLAAALLTRGIGYSHIKELGDPKEGRDAARRGDLDTFRAVFQSHLSRPAAQAALGTAGMLAAQTPTVLLCYERDPKTCHRAIVADALKDVCSLSVRHLGVAHGGRRPGAVAKAA